MGTGYRLKVNAVGFPDYLDVGEKKKWRLTSRILA